MTKIATFAHTNLTGAMPVVRRAEVRRLRQWQEYTVQFFLNGEHLTDADYFTGGEDVEHLADAIATAKSFVFPPAVRAALHPQLAAVLA